MLSILIPVYNQDVRQLVADLSAQAIASPEKVELVVLDDASDAGICCINREVACLPGVSYKELHRNHGRSKIRNKLAELAMYDYLLFLDCDAKVDNPSFVRNYLKCCRGEVVVCGGTSYDNDNPDGRERLLRWYYGHKRESRSAHQRSLNPNGSFSSFNFLVSRPLFNKVKFEYNISGYGYEDTVFCYNIKKHGVEVKHIDNPLIHIGIDSNKVFLNKAFNSVENLHLLSQDKELKRGLQQEIKLLWCYKTIKNIGLVPLFRLGYRVTHTSIEKYLVAKGTNLFYYDMLRLGYLCTLAKN